MGAEIQKLMRRAVGAALALLPRRLLERRSPRQRGAGFSSIEIVLRRS